MKKTILIGMFLALMMVVSVLAGPPVPSPVKFKISVNGFNVDYDNTIITNLNTGEVLTVQNAGGSLRVENGVGFFDLSAFKINPDPFIPMPFGLSGNVIEIQACAIHVDCTFRFTIDRFEPRTINIVIDDSTIPIEKIVKIYICTDGSEVTDPNLCPVVEEEEEVVETETKVTASSDKTSASLNVDYGQLFDIKLDDNKISSLLDTEVNYDGENYDIKEEVYFKGIVKTSVDDEDFGLNPYLIIKEGDIKYKYIFEDKIPIEDFDLEEPYDFTFLGRELRIIEATDSEIILRSGVELFLQEGKSTTVEGYDVEVKTIGENSIIISVNGIEEIVQDGQDRRVGKLRVLVESILYKNILGATNSVELVIGTETDEKIKDGDDFELFEKDAEEYSWVISLGSSPQYIGIVNQEDYKDIEEDEDYKAIGIGEVISLPNDYVSLKFDSVSEFDMTDLSFKVKEKDGKDYLYVKGDSDDAFNFGSTDYDRIYVSSDGIYDEDLILITTNKVEIGDSDIFLKLGSVLIANLKIELDMSDISFLDHLGIIFKDPENGVEDKTGFKVSVPEDRPEVLITFELGLIISDEPVDEEEEEETEVVVPSDEVIPPVNPPVIPPPVPEVTPPVSPPTVPVTPTETPVDEPEDSSTLKTFLITLIAAIIGIFAWGKGFAGLIKYYLRLADETEDKELAKKYRARAEKMAKTVVTNFLAGKYKK